MNYQKIYDDICKRGQVRILPKDVYTEKHHIIPKCLGGGNEKSNISVLTAREHFLVHYILTRIYPNNSKIWNACFQMCVVSENQKRFIPNSRMYEFIKNEWSKLNRGPNHHGYGKPSPLIGRKLSEEICKKISNSLKGKRHSETFKKWLSETRTGEGNPFFGKTHSKETIEILSDLRKGENNPMFGKTHANSARELIRIARTGCVASPAVRAKMSDRMQNNTFSKRSPCIINDRQFESIRIASKELGIKEGTIAYRCNSNTFRWIYWSFV